MPEGGVNAAAARRRTGVARVRRRRGAAWLASVVVHGTLILVMRQGRWTWTAPLVQPGPALELELVDVTDSAPSPVAASPAASASLPRSPVAAATPRAVDRGSPRPEPGSPVHAPVRRGGAPSINASARPASIDFQAATVPLHGMAHAEAPSAASVVPPSPAGSEAAASSPAPAWLHTRRPGGEPPSPSPSPADDRTVFGQQSPRLPGATRLSLDDLSTDARARLAGADSDRALPERVPRISVDRLRAAREREEAALANVRAGRVDPFLHDYVRDARARFEEGARRIAAELPLDAQKTAETWVHGYAARVAEASARATAARNGAARDRDTRDGEPPEPSTERRPDILGAYGETVRAADAGAIERHVTVCVTVAAGRAPVVAVKRESRDPALDQLAREAFARATAARPVPGDAHAANACYDLRIRAFRMPPVPVFSCGIDKDGPTCAWPFKKITSVTVHLESVDYPDDHDPPSLLRRAR